MTVDAAEARVAGAAEVAIRQADAAPPRATDVGGDAAHFGGVVARHHDGAAVDHCNRKQHLAKASGFAQCLFIVKNIK